MSVSYDIYPEKGYILVRYSGSITAQESMEVFAATTQDPLWGPELQTFVDMSKTTEIDINFNQMMGMKRRKAQVLNSGPVTRIAFWAPHDLAYGIARMYASLNEGEAGQEIGVLRSRENALSFIGLKELA